MNKNKISRVFSLSIIPALALSAMVSCTAGFEEANRPGECVSPEELAQDNYNTTAFLIQMQNQAFPEQENDYQMTQDLIGNYLGRFMTYANDGFTANNFVKMNAPMGWVRRPFIKNTPIVVSAYNEIARLTKREGLSFAWAQILRAQSFLRFTDLYGAFPIGAEENASAYSSQEKVYKTLVSDLDAAIGVINGMIASAGGSLKANESADHVYHGDFVKWVKFANSLKLRMAIRMRFVAPDYAKEVGEAAVAAGVITENADNCGIDYHTNGLYKTSVEWGDSRACADIESYMNGYNDPRITKYFSPTKEEGDRPIIGCRAGANIGNKTTAVKAYSAANVVKETRGLWLTAAEMTFCRAEGALAGWSGMGGTVEELYNKAITLSFEQWGVGGAAAGYLADTESTPADYVAPEGAYSAGHSAMTDITIKWDNEASEEEQLERLIVQKWIALFPDGQEAWNEIRRTGFPRVFPVDGVSGTANRIPYDYQEPINNPENYEKAVQLLGGPDNYETKMWWQKR